MNRLRELRKKRKLSLMELSALVNINKSSLARYEVGETEMKEDLIKVLSNFFEVSVSYLLGDSNINDIKPKEQLKGVHLAMYNQAGELTEDQAKDVLEYIEFLKSKKQNHE